MTNNLFKTLISLPVLILVTVLLTGSSTGSTATALLSPPVYSEQKVFISGQTGDQFGASTAISFDTALIGAPGVQVGETTDQGAAYVYTHTATGWSLQQQLFVADGGPGDQFGVAVALEGDTALVGANLARFGPHFDPGAAYVFTRSGVTWSQQARLMADYAAPEELFGSSVALSGDTALVGAPFDDVGDNTHQGSAWSFHRSVTTWSDEKHFTAADGAAFDGFGSSLALYNGTALIGAPGAGDQQGAAYIFTGSGDDWSQQAKLTASDGAAGDRFGTAVALWSNTALVGAGYDDFVTDEDQGSAYVFTFDGMSWTQQAKLVASDGLEDDFFGTAVALWGNKAVVGAYGADVDSNEQGAAYLFTRNGTTWSKLVKLAASDGDNLDGFGNSVALDVFTVLVGASGDEVISNPVQGSAYFYEFEPASKVYLPLLLK